MSDPFQIFGIPPSFDVDLPELERRHRELSRALHPDRHAGKSAGERRRALGRAIEVNEAWRALRDPIKRAEALLGHLGLAVAENAEPKPEPALLMDMMERRERLADARRGGDQGAIQRLAADAEGEEQQTLKRLSQAFERVAQDAAASGPDAGARQQLLRDLGTLRYFRRFLDEVRSAEDELG